MFTITAYLLPILMLGGCNHIMGEHGMDNSARRRPSHDASARKKPAISKLTKLIEHMFHKEDRTIKEEIIVYLLNCARYTNKQSKDDQEHAVELFRKRILYMLPNYLNKKINDPLIYDLLSYNGVKVFFKGMHHRLPDDLNNNVKDHLIDRLLTYVNAERRDRYAKPYARGCAGAIADTAIHTVQCIMEASVNE